MRVRANEREGGKDKLFNLINNNQLILNEQNGNLRNNIEMLPIFNHTF